MPLGDATLSTIEDLLKQEYKEELVNLVFTEKTVFNKFEKRSETVGDGQGFYVSVMTGQNQSVSAGAMTGGFWNPAGRGSYDRQLVQAKQIQGVGKIELTAIKMATRKAAAIRKSLDTEIMALKDGISNQQGRMIFNDGLGTLASVAANAGPALVFTFNVGQYFQGFAVGDLIDVVAANGSAYATNGYGRTITAVAYNADGVSGTITINTAAAFVGADSGNITVVAGQRITRYNAITVGVTPTYKEITGLSGAIGDGTTRGLDNYQGIVASTQPLWQSVTLNGGNVTADPAMLRNAITRVAIQSSESPDEILSHQLVRDGYAETLEANRLFFDDKLAGGYSSLIYQNDGKKMPWTVDRWATPNEIYLPKMSRGYLGVVSTLDFDNTSGSILIPSPDRGQSVEFRMMMLCQLAIEKRNAHARIYNVANAS